MSHFRPVELRHASRLLNHGPTVLITSRDQTHHPQRHAAARSVHNVESDVQRH